ncbi:ABC transporter substrate-binding protein [Jannaschia sp. M317]|uniref:ABC transporter substrate-binding protein n=1 Tax=Jannaschia sp. M317 TaxID=2867011 RepID=UPI0021A86742|nr:extracellular solute-binding protein [Jannaschia sp. M317]UWQ17221.1 extracellular solute-binding protein [Jannaschia sp. M317]
MFKKSTTALMASAIALSAALPAFAQDVTLTMWHNHPEWKDRAQAILDAFEAENPGIKIDLEEIAGTNYSARLNTALAAGEAPDLFGLPAGNETLAAGNAGYAMDLTGKLDLSSLRATPGEAVVQDGKTWGVPILGAYSVGLYYHRNIFADLGMTPPTNQAEFLEMCAEMKAQGVTPLIVPASDGIVPSFMYMMLTASVLGTEGFAELRRGERKFTDPDLVAAADFLQDIGECMQPGALSTPYVEGKALAALGQGAMMPGGSADYAGYQEINPAVDLGVVPFPGVGDNAPATVTGLEYIYLVNSDTEHADAALTFLQWMLGDTAQQMVVDSITMSTSKNVAPEGNRILDEFVQASRSGDMRVFYELPETGNVWSVAQQNTAALFLGEISPEDFAAKLQDAVVIAE